MIILIRKKVLLCVALLLVFSATLACALRLSYVPVFSSQRVENDIVYVIDAGHGGEDGGAVSQDGTVESAINLEISQKLDALLRFLGHETVMTRADDRAIYDDDAKTLREKKSSDLKNRVALVNRIDNATLISIHQNSLPSSVSVHGSQVFYAKTPLSEDLAQSIQAALNDTINIEHAKEKKQIPSSVYLMKNVSCRAVLVECGFLSNPEETSRLKTPEYQRKLVAAIAAGVLSHENT